MMRLNSHKLQQFNQAYVDGALQASVYGASPFGIVILLYESALKAIAEARQAIYEKRFDNKARMMTKAMEILEGLQLMLDLDAGTEAAINLNNLYLYMKTRLGKASLQNDVQILDEVSGLFNILLPAWKQVDGRMASTVTQGSGPVTMP